MNQKHSPSFSKFSTTTRREFMSRVISGVALGAIGSPVALRPLIAQAAEGLSPGDRGVFVAKFENYVAAKGWSASVSDDPVKFAPALKSSYAATAPGNPEDLAFARAIAAAENANSRYGALDSSELITDVKDKLALAGLVARAAPGWGTATAGLLGSLAGASPAIIKLLEKADNRWNAPHEKVFTESLRGSAERIYAEELRLARLQQRQAPGEPPEQGRPVPGEVRKDLPPGLGDAAPHRATVVNLSRSEQQLYSAVNQGRVKTREDAEKVASHVGQQAVNRVASNRAPVQTRQNSASANTKAEVTPKRTTSAQEGPRKPQVEARQQFYYNMGEINGAAQTGAVMIQMMGGSSQDAQKFAGTITSVGGAALTVGAYIAGTLPLGPFAVVGAVAGAVGAIFNLFKEDQSANFFVELTEAIRSIGIQLEVLKKNQLLIIEGLQEVQKDLSNFQFENRDLVRRLSDKIDKLEALTQAVYKSQRFDRFNKYSRAYADALKRGLTKAEAMDWLTFCRDFAIDDAYAPEFTCGSQAEKTSWYGEGSIGNMATAFGDTIRAFGASVPKISTEAVGRKSEFPCPAIWRLGSAHFVAAALQADSRKALAIDSQEVSSLAKTYLLPIYEDGCALRETCITMSSQDLVTKAIGRMRDLLGLSEAPAAPAGSVFQILKRVATQRDKNLYGDFNLVEENNIWRSVLTEGKWPAKKDPKSPYYGVDGKLYEINRGTDPLNEALRRGLLKAKEGEPSKSSVVRNIILNAPINTVPGEKEGYLLPKITRIVAKRVRQTLELTDPGSEKTVARCYKDKIEWAFVVQEGLGIPRRPSLTDNGYREHTVEGKCDVVGISQSGGIFALALKHVARAAQENAPQMISNIPDLLRSCVRLLREDDHRTAADVRKGVPKDFVDAFRGVDDGNYMTKVAEHGRMLNLMIAMANWRSIPDLADDFPIWAASHNVLSTVDRFEAFIKNWYLQQEPREKYAEDLIKAFRELYESDFKGIQDVAAAVDPVSSIAIVDHTLAALDTFLSACSVPHEPFVKT